MGRLTLIVTSALVACSGAAGEDYLLDLDVQVPPGHDPFAAGDLTLWIDDAAGTTHVPLAAAGTNTWEAPEMGALEAAKLGLSWTGAGTPLSPLDGADLLAWGRSAPVTHSEGDATVSVLVGEAGRLGTWDDLAVERATIRPAVVALEDGAILLFGGSGPSTWRDLDGGSASAVGGYDRVRADLAFVEVAQMPRITTSARDELARTAATATLLPDGLVLVAGGRRSWIPTTQVLASTFLWDPATATSVWQGEIMRPTGRSEHVAVRRGDAVWLLGGVTNEDGGTTTDFTIDAFDIASRSWSRGPSLINVGPIGFAHAEFPNGDIVVCGGGAQQGPGLLVPTSGCVLLAASGGGSTALPSLPAGARMGHALVAVDDDTLVVSGGTDVTTGDGTLAPALGAALADVWRLDLSGGSWEALPALTTPRAHHAMVLRHDGTVLVVGGTDAATGSPPLSVGVVVDCPEILDLTAGTVVPAPACEAAGAGAWPSIASAPGYGTFVLAGADMLGAGGRAWGLLTTGPSQPAP